MLNLEGVIRLMIHPYLIFAPRNKIKAYEDCKLQH